MAWLELEFCVPGPDVDHLSESLFSVGAISVDVTDADEGSAKEKAIFAEPGEIFELSWNANRVVALFDSDVDVTKVIKNLEEFVNVSQLSDYQVRTVEDQDWVRLTQKQFDPIQVTDRIRITPSWSDVGVPSDVEIVLDPGLAFGTGSHPTTRLCLQWLDQASVSERIVVDYGCGSGILGIVAKKLGSKGVFCVDIDENALIATEYNAQRNGVDVNIQSANDEFKVSADVLVANILSAPLKVLAAAFASIVRPGGRIALSGILVEQEDELCEVYQKQFDIKPFDRLEGWVCLEGVKRPD
ncbi:MAG: 50S ribosomal protein L11 methyltransferase [Betaproteobacteria bacterium]